MTYHSNPNGFTLIETLVAIALLTMTIVLPFFAIQRTLVATAISMDELVATALAQEALEYVHGVRDNNYLAGRTGANWLYGVMATPLAGSANCETPNRCTIDATRTVLSDAVFECPSNNCNNYPLYLSDTNLYTQVDTGNRTPYVRHIQVREIEADKVVEITVTVTWSYHGTRSIQIKDVLTNWL